MGWIIQSTEDDTKGSVFSSSQDINFTAAVAADISLKTFQDTFLGNYTSNPTQTVHGTSIAGGMLYFNQTDNRLKYYDGSNWVNSTPTSSEQTNINSVAADATDIGTVASNISDVNAVAAKSTQIGLLGTSDAIADMNTLGTSDVVNDMNILATSANVTNMNALGTNNNVSHMAALNATGVITNMANLNASGVIANINTVAGDITAINTVAGKSSLLTSDFVADLNTLATSAIVTDMNILATAANVDAMSQLGSATVVSDMATLGSSGVVTNIATVAGNISDISSVAGISSNVSSVAADASDIGTVASNIASVNTVNSNISDINTVAGISSAISTVNSNATAINAVNSNSTNINAVNANSSNINALAAKTTELGLLGTSAVITDMSILGTADVVADMAQLASADFISDLNTLATSDIVTDMNLLATTANVANMSALGTSTNVTNMANLNASGVIANINTVGGISSDVTTVAGLSSTISAVNSNSSNINAVNSNSSNINTVAGNTSNINTVAGISSDVTTVANDATDIGTVSTNISNVNTLANALSGTNAYTVTVVNSGGNKFALNGATNPTLTLKRGITYTFDQSDNSNSGHPLAFKDGSGNAYTSGVTVTGSAGQAGAKVVFAVPSNAPSSLLYYCTVHGNAMGNTISVQDDNVAIVAGISSNITTVAGVASNVTTVAGIASNVTTVASNVSGINDFADRYRVASSAPSSNNDEGDLYYNTTSNQLFVYDGSSWIAAALDASSALVPSNNLSDVASASTARSNLGLGTIATQSSVDSNIDTHLNTSTASSNEFLQWSGSDYQWSAVDLSAYAPLNSPALTGTPTAPTASAGTNNTQIATTAYTDTAVANLVDSAPGTLNTLNELAAALGDDANFSTTVTNSIATKLNSSAVSTYGGTLIDDADAAAARTTLGLGDAATKTVGISNGNVATFTSGVADNDFLKIDGTTVEGRSAAEMRSDLNVEDGATANSAGNGITISSGVINHSDTSSQASSNNSGRTYIQDITLDTYGHVTGIATATETVTNTDTNTTYSAGTNLGLSGTTFNLDNSITLSGTAQATRYYIDGTSKYIDSVSGDYGTIRVQGTTGSWAGYAIQDDWVFMSNGAGRCGIYNDTDNEWSAQFYQNAQVDLYYNGNITLSTQSEGILVKATGNGTDGVIYLGHNYHSYIKNDEGSYVKITTGSNENFIYAAENSHTYLYWDGSWTLRTNNGGINVRHPSTTVDGTISLGSSEQAKIINDAGTYLALRTDGDEYGVYCQENGYTYLYYNGSWRIRASNQGITLNGALATSASDTAYGSSGQVLTSNGNASPTWQDAGGGGWEFVSGVRARHGSEGSITSATFNNIERNAMYMMLIWDWYLDYNNTSQYTSNWVPTLQVYFDVGYGWNKNASNGTLGWYQSTRNRNWNSATNSNSGSFNQAGAYLNASYTPTRTNNVPPLMYVVYFNNTYYSDFGTGSGASFKYEWRYQYFGNNGYRSQDGFGTTYNGVATSYDTHVQSVRLTTKTGNNNWHGQVALYKAKIS